MYDFNKQLSEYGDSLARLELAVRGAIWTSIQATSKNGGDRRFWSSVLLTRLATISRSLLVLCPKPTKTGMEGNWDFASIASLARNLFEGAAFFHYFTERVEAEEWRARLNLMQLNDATHRVRMFELFDNNAEAAAGQAAADKLKTKLQENIYFQTLDPRLQKQLLQGHRPSIFNLRENIEKLSVDPKIWGIFELLSSHTHTLPLSFYRMVDQGRTGVENYTDSMYIAMAMDLAEEILKGIVKSFQADFADLVTFTPPPVDIAIDDLLTATNPPSPPLNRAQRRAVQKRRRD